MTDRIGLAVVGADYWGHNLVRNAMATPALRLSIGAIAHVHVNWLSPIKIRTMVIGGQRTLVWDDMNPSQHPRTDLPVTERPPDSTLILPLYHSMTEQEHDTAVGIIRTAAGLRAA